jgi:hypothetical protein
MSRLSPTSAAVFLSVVLVAFPAGQFRSSPTTIAWAIPLHNLLAQGDDNGDDVEVSPGDVEKYVAVYQAMQRDRSLTIEQAVTQQGLTLQAFRTLESRVERDDAALQRARDELQASASKGSPADRPTNVPSQK